MRNSVIGISFIPLCILYIISMFLSHRKVLIETHFSNNDKVSAKPDFGDETKSRGRKNSKLNQGFPKSNRKKRRKYGKNETKESSFIHPPFWRWKNMSAERMVNFDPFSCYELMWKSPRDRINKEKKVAIALAITRMDMTYIAVMEEQVKSIRRVSDRDIVIIVLMDSTTPEILGELIQTINKNFLGVKFLVRSLGFKESDLAKSFIWYQKRNKNCCGLAEYIKLEAFNLPYDQVLFIDNEVTLVKSPEILFQCEDVDFLYTSGSRTPLNGGMFVLKPSDALYAHMIETLKSVSHTYNNKFCYEGLGCGPCKPKERKHCWGSEGPQGFLPYYFVKRQDPNLKVYQVSTCTFNYLSDRLDICKYEKLHTYPYIVHKDLDNKLALLKEKMIMNSPSKKKCRPDFWILGTRKGGSTALYTSMIQHPQIASVNIRGTVLDGEALGNIQDLENYNKRFNKAEKGLLVGDSTVFRISKDARSITQKCGHKYTKFLILIRDPIERCHSQMLMRARLGLSRMNINTNISEVILRDLEIFNEASSYSTDWAQSIYPNALLKKYNCIDVGVYVAQLKRWLYHASITNIRIYFTEHFKIYTDEIVHDALQFVGISREEVENFALNKSETNANARTKEDLPSHQQITDALRRELENTFAPYNRMLKELLNVELPWKY